MAKKVQCKVAGILFNALIESSVNLEAEVPEYVTEDGYTINDSIIVKNETLNLTLFVTDTPVTWSNKKHASDRTSWVMSNLEEKFLNGKTVTVVTRDKTWKNMAITSLTLPRKVETGRNAAEIQMELKKIVKTKSKTVKIPSSYGKAAKSKANAGTAGTKTGSNKSNGSNNSGSNKGSSSSNNGSSKSNRGSILYNGAKKIGLIK